MRGHVRRRGKRWATVLYAGKGPDGRKQYEWKSFATESEAQGYLSRRLALQHAGTYTPYSTRTLAGFLEGWLQQHQAGWSLRTTLRYREYVRLHLTPALGTIRLTKLTAGQLQQLYVERIQHGLSPTTVHGMYVMVRAALAEAVRIGDVLTNVAAIAAGPRMIRRRMTIWDEEQIRLFLAEARRSSKHALLYEVALMTGMRHGELLALRWADLDWSRAVIMVTRTGNVISGRGFVVREPKTKHARRAIAIGRNLVRKLARARVLAGAQAADAWVFARADGQPLGSTQQHADFHRTAARAGVPAIRFHDLRHTHATQLLIAGVPVKVVQERLGHSSPAFTLDYYAHVLPTIQRDAAALLERRILGHGPRPRTWTDREAKKRLS